MIKVTIERVTVEKYVEVKNFITKSTPTDKVQERDGYNSSKVLCAEEFAVRDVEQERTIRTTLLNQEILDENTFSLGMVIKAINGL